MKHHLLLLFIVPALFVFTAKADNLPASQNHITLNVEQAKISEIFSEITSQTGLRFSYNPKTFDTTQQISLHVQNKSLDDVLTYILSPAFTYKEKGKHIIITETKEDILLTDAKNIHTHNDTFSFEHIPASQQGLNVPPATQTEQIKVPDVSVPKSPPASSTFINVQTVSLQNISNVQIDYTIDHVAIYESDTDELIIKEHLSKHDNQLFATFQKMGTSLTIKHGKRMWLLGSSSRIEVFIPENYKGRLEVSNVRGDISIHSALDLQNLTLSSMTGSITILPEITANHVDLKTTTGNITTNDLNGSIAINSVSGKISVKDITGNFANITNMNNPINIENIKVSTITIRNTNSDIHIKEAKGKFTADALNGGIRIDKFSGSGSFTATLGTINIICSRLESSINAKTTTGNISLTVPESSSYHFIGETRTGEIRSYFNEGLPYSGKSIREEVGSMPLYVIETNTATGNIYIHSRADDI